MPPPSTPVSPKPAADGDWMKGAMPTPKRPLSLRMNGMPRLNWAEPRPEALVDPSAKLVTKGRSSSARSQSVNAKPPPTCRLASRRWSYGVEKFSPVLPKAPT